MTAELDLPGAIQGADVDAGEAVGEGEGVDGFTSGAGTGEVTTSGVGVRRGKVAG
ncbi:MAG: hypothetical protein QOH88_1141 [Verrucomicrobiota bacterium]|jgi:hypothetical protein